ncbi:sel-1-like protein [Anaeramoeba flamelloides]|uniref:Sel-1-like protein n=1 Tax=Anaeramoeba flamelloides TaxID=1746091 RepID=A0ABQ8YN02_9EUKA|nr:sel-1-like protein [Anaeramoeba flamelloides]
MELRHFFYSTFLIFFSITTIYTFGLIGNWAASSQTRANNTSKKNTTIKLPDDFYQVLESNSLASNNILKPNDYSIELYENGSKLIQSDTLAAIELLQKSAENGELRAWIKLGKIFEYGKGTARIDNCLSEYYYRKCASYGEAKCHTKLAFYLSTGKCQKEPDQSLALLHLELAARSGDFISQIQLGYRYYQGIGTLKSCENAHKYYSNIALYVLFQLELLHANDTGIGSAKLPMVRIINSDSKIEPETQNNKRLIEFYEELSDRGDSQAQNIIGEIYLKGKGDHQQNFNKAFDYFALAASQGHLTAKVNLAKMYLKGLGVEQNYESAFKLFIEASDSGDPNARYELGMMYLNGIGVIKNETLSRWYLENAGFQGHTSAMFNLANMLRNGQGGERDIMAAFDWMDRAAKLGYRLANYYLAEMYYRGEGTEKNCELSVKHYKKVVELGPWRGNFQKAFQYWQNKNYFQSLIIYENLAELGYEVAQHNAATIYEKFIKIEDMETVLNGNFNFNNKSLNADLKKKMLLFEKQNRALAYYYRSANLGSVENLNKIGDAYFFGKGIEKNSKIALKNYLSASDQRNARGSFSLGRLYERGIGGISKDFLLAKRYYDLSLEQEPNSDFGMMIVYTKWGFNFCWNQPSKCFYEFITRRIKDAFDYNFKTYFVRKISKLRNHIKPTEPSSPNSKASGNDVQRKSPLFNIDFEFLIIIISIFIISTLLIIRHIKKTLNQRNNNIQRNR